MFVVSCRNVAMGIFSTMDDAIASICLTHSGDSCVPVNRHGPHYAEAFARRGDELFDYTITQVNPSTGPGKLFS
jgi:hypothetical protein